MKAMRNLGKILLIAFGGAIIFYACSKEGSASSNSTVPAGKQQLNLYLTDGPSFFDSVLIDIKSVKVLVDTCDKSRRRHTDTAHICGVWDSLTITPGVYNLLSLRNGIDTLLAGGVVTDGTIRKIVITLGTNNSLVKDSVKYPLHLLNNQTTVTINLWGNEWENFQTGKYRLWLDFDCGHSIVRLRDGEFYLAPYIRAFLVKETGVVKGVILPAAATPIVTVYNSSDSAYAIPFWNGQWQVRGLSDGTYSVFINGSNGYQDTTITNVSVTVGKTTDLGTITLHK